MSEYYPGQRVRLWETQYAPDDSGDAGIALFSMRNFPLPPAHLIYLVRRGLCLWVPLHEMTVDRESSLSFTSWYVAVEKDRDYTTRHPGF